MKSLLSSFLVLVFAFCLPHWVVAQAFDWVNGTGRRIVGRLVVE